MKKIYLAARYSRNAEMREYRDILHSIGYAVTSHWIDQHGGLEAESCSFERLNNYPEDCDRFAQVDIRDLQLADTVISFTEANPGSSKGGRHIEHGMAIALGKTIVIVGPRENVFHCSADLIFDSFEDCVRYLLSFGDVATSDIDSIVNHPSHYNSHPSGVECITVTEHFNFNIGNAIKYLWRSGLKDASNPAIDLRKAAWYIDRELERIGKMNTADTPTGAKTGQETV